MNKNRKAAKFRGKRTHGWGSKKKHRGKGSKGGVGYAGSAKHKRVGIRKYDPQHFAKHKLKSIKTVIKIINVQDLEKMKESEIDLTKLGYDKLLGKGNIKKKVTVKIDNFSKTAKAKIEKAGGKIMSDKKTEVKEEPKQKSEKA